ncbi:ATP-dependent DNA helicase UvrD2 [Nonomuraea sp. NPDC049480]|uniref:ATP-dependent DNA helicase UvrD2 n=1 Tax=Nonomuraea sp. NPDC049480 TaxID=3364353 RepID=UPI0037A4A67B
MEDVLIGLDPEQREVAEAVRGPVCVLAGAGTGKTRAITHRIAYAVRSGVVDAQSVLAVTFTTRAAGELRQRLRALGAPAVQARTFHAAALRQLTYFWPRVIGGEAPSVIESKLPVLAEACRRLRKSPDRSELRDIASEIEWAKVTQIGPEDYVAAAAKHHRTPPSPAEEIARLYEAYEQLRRERHLVDFETILELTAAVMTEHQEVAAQIRQQYRYFVVDEYQDVNPLQKLLLDTWLGGRDDICVVGDPNQTIYSFTGASPRYLTGFAVEHPQAAVIRLIRDYRSTPQVVDLANLVIAKSRSPHRMELVAQRPDGPKPVFSDYDDEPAEAAGVARAIRKLLDKDVPAREIAVLFRVNSQSAAYEEALAKAGIPYVLRGAERFFERPEVRQAVVLLRGAARSAAGEPLASEVHHILAGVGLTPAPPGGGKARERWESLKALADLAEDMAAEGGDLPAYVAELERRASEQHAPPVEGVTLASLHAAKGLEWDAVFLVGLTDGMLPIIYAETPEQIEEERRLLYVGVTRAREHLTLSWALARAPGGRKSRRPSRFLDGLTGRISSAPRVAAVRERRTVAAPVSCRVCAKTLVAAAEQKLGRCATCPADYDEALLERLKAWRTATAKESKIPPYVVFTDVTLQAIAERAPTTERELLSIAGIGRVKIDRYGEAVLSLCRGS